jgi:hypothetical protein
MKHVMLYTATLATVINPFAPDFYWGSVTREDVEEAIAQGRFEEIPYSHLESLGLEAGYNHAGRIAYLVQNPDDNPIHLEFNDNGVVEIQDGCHRLAAAIYSGKPRIAVCYDSSPGNFETFIRKQP